MNSFRIIQTHQLTEALPFIVEERRRVWYMPWPIWCPVREWSAEKTRFWTKPRKFQSLNEARMHIERRLKARAKRQAQQECYSQERQQLPRVIELLPMSMQG